MSESSFRDRVVIVTGASSGIGEAAARRFAAAGARVVLVARTAEALERVAASIRAAGGVALPIALDVSAPSAPEGLVARVVEELGGIDGLVNNAGANHRGPLEERSAAEVRQILEVNLIAPLLLTRAALPSLRARGGFVVNVASLAGRVPLADEVTYSASKWGLRGFSLSLRDELESAGVRVSLVSPGPVDTGFIRGAVDHIPDMVFSQPISTAEEIAGQILASAADGAAERTPSLATAAMTTVGYLAPGIRRALRPLLERRGRARKLEFAKRSR